MNRTQKSTSLTIAVGILYALIACFGVILLLIFVTRGNQGSTPTATVIVPSPSPLPSATYTVTPLASGGVTFTPSVTEFPTYTLVVLPQSTSTRTPTKINTPSRTPTKTSVPSGSTATRTATATSTRTSTSTPTATSTFLSSVTPTSTSTPTPTTTSTASATATSAPVSSAVFAVGPGGSDVIPHQIVRTSNNFLYIFANQQSSGVLRVYHTNSAGFPNSASDFASPITFTESNDIISVDAVYDGGAIIHVLINTQSGAVKDYPFDTSTNTFKSAISLASDGGTIGSGLYVGTSGVSGMMDTGGVLHVGYWTNTNHIIHGAYTYNSGTNTLTATGSLTQVDTSGSANHPSLAMSPSDNSLTVAWVSETGTTPQILTRTRSSAGSWGSVQTASTATVWTSTANGLNIDQGPSLLIDSAGTKHMVYIEAFDSSVGDYGRIHYVTDSGSGWNDQGLNIFSHDPALGIKSGTLYIIGHGHPLNVSCKSMDEICTVQKSGGSWGNPVLFASPPSGFSFDASPSVKWSVVGFNRPDVLEFIFFMTPYDSPTLYYGRLP